MASPDDPTVHLLWTSGWDSTFRLLQLLNDTSAVIQPWYVRSGRSSRARELETMRTIRAAIHERDPAWSDRIRSTHFVEQDEIPADPEITACYRGLKQRLGRFGNQYDFLSRLATHSEIDRLELCVFNRSGEVMFSNCEKVATPLGPTFHLKERPIDPNMEVFRPFSLPLLDWNKLDIQRSARESGFDDLMELTWFCHEPRFGQPCGRCQPCLVTIEEGLGHRIPWPSRMLGHLRMTRRAIKSRLIDFYHSWPEAIRFGSDDAPGPTSTTRSGSSSVR